MYKLFRISLAIFFWTATVTAFSQQTDSAELLQVQNRLQQVEKAHQSLSNQLRITEGKLSRELAATNDSLKLLRSQLAQANEQIRTLNQELGAKIDDTAKTTNGRITTLDSSLSQTTRNWIIAVCAITAFTVLLFFLLRNRFRKEHSSLSESLNLTNRALDERHAKLSDSIQLTKKELEEESIRLDSKLADILEAQLSILKNAPAQTKPDHSLALKMADEIIRIQKNITQIDSSTKGLKQLNASVKRIIENLEQNGYDIVDLLNKPYSQGMKVIANFRPDENLKPDEQIITRILKPQVNFNGTMIQSAEIEVSQGV